ncbi:dTDP-4-dehydrorhamnose 3,5-epimerase family protein [Rhabdobacter roseus]|uniref:dTDP-4-dehydrorhamnose 3,5-epimerase n=1 Tax=Rhabdobacter roseus TaxID=1655419 RepID=A0A840TZP3_9BACT|nr:dTDP-4-dehydrorhamnose 3,5-epimerase family protein [Rhabdobacter roseus]MBB5285370.1 dTDP-4-dehydrorhamnose 3,5-epimerase [Rhabdobacter roseus]
MNWNLPGTEKDPQSITADWTPSALTLIEGVQVKEVKNVLKNNGYLTEIYRKEWEVDGLPVDQVFQVTLLPKGISAWHAHQFTTDRIFVNVGSIKVVLYDGREGSPTYGMINEFRGGTLRPMLIIVPPQVWHGVQNYTDTTASLLNIVDQAYQYEDPDHWRIPGNTPHIPYQFS